MNKFVILALVVLGVQLISAQTLDKNVDCKCKLPANSRIVGGEEVRYPIPWAVSLQRTDFGHFCGGTVINKNWIMSAAHCIVQFDSAAKLALMRVRVGITTLDTAQTTQNTFKVKRILYDSRYDRNNATTIGDISLIELDGSLEFTKTLQPACLPASTVPEPYNDRPAALQAVGWGSIKVLLRTPFGQSPAVISNKLKQAFFDVDETLAPGCKYQGGYLVCLKQTKSPDSICAGDSGTGLIHQKNGVSRVVGIAQFVTGIRKGLAVQFCNGPGAYQRVSPLLPLIQKVIGDDYCSKN